MRGTPLLGSGVDTPLKDHHGREARDPHRLRRCGRRGRARARARQTTEENLNTFVLSTRQGAALACRHSLVHTVTHYTEAGTGPGRAGPANGRLQYHGRRLQAGALQGGDGSHLRLLRWCRRRHPLNANITHQQQPRGPGPGPLSSDAHLQTGSDTEETGRQTAGAGADGGGGGGNTTEARTWQLTPSLSLTPDEQLGRGTQHRRRQGDGCCRRRAAAPPGGVDH